MRSAALNICIGEISVCRLVERRDAGGAVYELDFDPEWVADASRPILTLAARDWVLSRPRRSTGRMPAFLTNIIPEERGAYRRRVARSAGVEEDDEFGLLAYVGADLPGAIVAEPVDAPIRREVARADVGSTDATAFRASLGGMQLKFSVTDRLTLRATGRGGRWILKIPEPGRPLLPRAERAALEWARAVGFDVPETDVVRVCDVQALPEDVTRMGGEALVVRRFDRTEAGGRVHVEELASALNAHPGEKYAEASRLNYVALARFVRAVAGEAEMRTFIRRVAFDALVGNGDGHLKNWAFIFRDGRTPRLAPVYDVVPTTLFGYPQALALPWTSDSTFRGVTVDRVRQFAAKLDLPRDELVEDLLGLARDVVRVADGVLEQSGLEPTVTRGLRESAANHPLALG